MKEKDALILIRKKLIVLETKIFYSIIIVNVSLILYL